MPSNPFQALLASRKFLLLVMDVLGSLVLYFATKYAAPSIVNDIKYVLLALQPVFIMIIYAIAKEDAAQKASGFQWSDLNPGTMKDCDE